jgi:hypothetical protein
MVRAGSDAEYHLQTIQSEMVTDSIAYDSIFLLASKCCHNHWLPLSWELWLSMASLVGPNEVKWNATGKN